MKKYIAIKLLSLMTGIVLLTDKQAKQRQLVLKPLKKKGQYEITGQCWFKPTEEFGYEGEIPKTIAADLEEIKKSNAAAKKEALITAQEAVKKASDEFVMFESALEESEAHFLHVKSASLENVGGDEEALSDEQKEFIEAAENVVTERTNILEMAQEVLIKAKDDLEILS